MNLNRDIETIRRQYERQFGVTITKWEDFANDRYVFKISGQGVEQTVYLDSYQLALSNHPHDYISIELDKGIQMWQQEVALKRKVGIFPFNKKSQGGVDLLQKAQDDLNRSYNDTFDAIRYSLNQPPPAPPPPPEDTHSWFLHPSATTTITVPKEPPNLSFADLIKVAQAQIQDQLLQNIFSSSGVYDYMRGHSRSRNPEYELRRSLNRALTLIGQGEETLLLTNKMDQLALAILTERRSEFLQGVAEDEDLFLEEWRDSNMGRQWKDRGYRPEADTAKIWLDEQKGVLCCRFPYRKEVIEEIKERIPRGKKQWNPDDKIWEFSIEAIDLVVEIMTKHFAEVINLLDLTPPPPQIEAKDQLLSLLDQEDIQKIHKMLALKYHPDRQGGDGDKMAKINQIFGRVKK